MDRFNINHTIPFYFVVMTFFLFCNHDVLSYPFCLGDILYENPSDILAVRYFRGCKCKQPSGSEINQMK